MSVRSLARFRHYYIFFMVKPRRNIGFGIALDGEPYECEHFCTRDLKIYFFKWVINFWAEDTQ
jgi:hypothetical protein